MDSLVQRASAVFEAARGLTENDVPALEIASSSNVWRLRTRVNEALSSAENVVKELAAGRRPSNEDVAGLVLDAAAAVTELLKNADISQQRIQQLEQEVQQLKQQVASLQVDKDSLLLRQVATQAVHKLARLVTPSLTPSDLRGMTLKMVKETAEDKELLGRMMATYPLVKVAVSALCSLARPIAHPVLEPPVDEESLRAVIRRCLSGPIRKAAEQLLDCLVDMSRKLDEPLFVATS